MRKGRLHWFHTTTWMLQYSLSFRSSFDARATSGSGHRRSHVTLARLLVLRSSPRFSRKRETVRSLSADLLKRTPLIYISQEILLFHCCNSVRTCFHRFVGIFEHCFTCNVGSHLQSSSAGFNYNPVQSVVLLKWCFQIRHDKSSFVWCNFM